VILRDGAGGTRHAPGDYLYMNGVGRRFRQGAWGILRVLPGRSDDLKPLPGTNPAAGPALPSPTDGRPPAAADPGSPCPAGAPLRSFDVSAIRLPGSAGGEGRKFAYVRTRDAAAVEAGTRRAEPLVLHAAAGDCVRVRLTNDHATDRVSFHVGELVRDPASSGANVGYTPEQTVARDETRTYLYYADTDKIGSALISDLGGDDTAKDGLYGALVVAPAGATFTDPVTWQPTDTGAQVDVHVPGKPGYRDFTLALADDDPQIGASFMPYPEDVKGPALVNYATAPRPDTPDAFSSAVHGDPATPILRAYAGDQVKVHALVTPGSEQVHTFNLGGLSWGLDAGITRGNELATRHIGPWGKVDAVISGGAGGRARAPGDYFYGDLRRPFTEAGMWGLQRVLPRGTCPATPQDGLACLGQPDLEAPTVTIDAKPAELGNDDSPQFGFSASEPASFECSTSTGADSFRPCASPLRAGPLDDGTWTFKVRATDPAGNTGQAASHRFTVDTTAPSVTASPAGGSYPGPQQVTVTTSEPATVYWTDDGTTPTDGSRRYDGPLAVDASRTLKFLAVDEAGNGSAVATEAYTIAPPGDTTAPSVAAPDARPLAGSQLGATGTVKVRVAWSGSDAGSGVAGYELQQRTGTGEFQTVSSGLAATADRTLQVGTTYQFRTRATDAAGNQTGWRTGPAFRVRLSESNQQAVRYSAGWTWAKPAGASGGSVRYATAAGATATFTFTGTSMAWVAPTGPQAGRAEVWVDGARAATVDLRTATARPRQLVFATGWATTGVHTVQVKVLGTAGRPRVDVDGFVAMVRP
jgi:chitobiase/beta-hexosaminidase-like protein/Big-like domain-containing protein